MELHPAYKAHIYSHREDGLLSVVHENSFNRQLGGPDSSPSGLGPSSVL